MPNWNPQNRTLEKIQRKCGELIENFEDYFNSFDCETFSGPSLYFHYKCILTGNNMNINEKLNDERFIEYLYAT